MQNLSVSQAEKIALLARNEAFAGEALALWRQRAGRSLGILRLCRPGERIELSLLGLVHGLQVLARPIGRRRRHP